jgi:hypothetical protein
VRIGVYVDGVRSVLCVGYVEGAPLFWVDYGAVARSQDPRSGYPAVYADAYEHGCGLLAPLRALPPQIASRVTADLLDDPLADLCLEPSSRRRARQERIMDATDSEWRARVEGRTRLLMRRAERRVALRAAARLRTVTSDGWLLQDGGLARLIERADPPERWARVVGCVKTHTRAPFGVAGERRLASLRLGERSAAFQLRSGGGAHRFEAICAESEPDERTPIAWYLRVRPARQATRLLAGVVRLEIAPTPDWSRWVDALSWSALDQNWTPTSATDAHSDGQCAGVIDCERFLRAQRRLPIAIAQRRRNGADCGAG